MKTVCTKSVIQGFTLVELMTVMAIGAILSGLAMSNYSSSLLKNRLTGYANTFLTALALARNESVKRNGTVTLCQSANGASCGGVADFASGWIVFYDANANGVIEAPDCTDNANAAVNDCIIRTGAALDSGFTLTGSTPNGAFSFLSFSAKGLNPGAKAQFTLSHPPDVEDRKICVGITGKSRVSKPTVNPVNPITAAPDCP